MTLWNFFDMHHEVLVSAAQLAGLILASYAVYLAFRRNKSFERQAATAEKNLFSERLSRATESLGKDDLADQNAGFQLINSLIADNEDEPDSHALLSAILHGYIRD